MHPKKGGDSHERESNSGNPEDGSTPLEESEPNWPPQLLHLRAEDLSICQKGEWWVYV